MINCKKHIVKTTIIFSATLALTLSHSAHAQEPPYPTELDAIYACKSITESAERLACFDKAVGFFEAAAQKGEVVTVSKSAFQKVERDAFGFNIPSLPSLGKLFGGKHNQASQKKNDLIDPVKPAVVSKISKEKKQQPAISKPKASKIKDVDLLLRRTTEFGRNKTRFFMTNGQIWEQIESGRPAIRKMKKGEIKNVRISKGALGSFKLRINGKGSAIRVRRVR
jgi:hypothetical protein